MDDDPIDLGLKILVLTIALLILLCIVLIALIPIELFLRSQGMSLGIEFK
jgi:hypothetical protein